jgi:hypothetical protein
MRVAVLMSPWSAVLVPSMTQLAWPPARYAGVEVHRDRLILCAVNMKQHI